MSLTDAEMARANTTGDESAPIPTHDLKLAWSFMKNGFMGSKFRFNFPNDPDAKTDVLPENVPSQRDEVPVNLDSMMRSTLARLTSSSSALELIPSPTVPDQSFASSHGTPPRERTPEIMSSPDTVGSPVRRAEEPTTRRQELEPWSWANALIAQCNDIIDTVRPRHPETSDEWNAVSKLVDGTLLSERVIDGQRWILSKTNMDTGELCQSRPADSSERSHLRRGSSRSKTMCRRCPDRTGRLLRRRGTGSGVQDR